MFQPNKQVGRGGGGKLVSSMVVVVGAVVCVWGGEGRFSKSIFSKPHNFPEDLFIDNERQRLEYHHPIVRFKGF